MNFFEKFLDYCKDNKDIRAVALQGSRVYAKNKIDKYSDYDVILIVSNISKFTLDAHWLDNFGDILIRQIPNDWYKHLYDYSGNEPFTHLVQYKSGSRLDINLFDIENLDSLKEDHEPREVLINKDKLKWFKSISATDYKNITFPSEFEFENTVNEFFWLSLYIAKGIARKELIYTREMYEHYFIPMLYKMIGFYLGLKFDFNITLGKSYKYFSDYLTETEMKELENTLPSGNFDDIKFKLIYALELFAKYASIVNKKLDYFMEDYSEIKDFINKNYFFN